MAARVCVAVSGEGTNLRALRRAEKRGLLVGEIGLVLADRPCPALAFAADEGLPTAIVAPAVHADRTGWDAALAQTLERANVDWLVLAGFMRILGRRTLERYAGRALNVHPSLLPGFAGAHAVRDALAAGVRTTGVTVHFVDQTLDGGPIVAQEVVPVLPGDDERTLLERLHAVEHRLLPRCVALACAGALSLAGGRVTIDDGRAAALPEPRRALLSVSDKRGLADFGRALAGLGFELVSTGGTARTLRQAGLEVVDVAAVTGFPEMLDGRVKTLHPRISAGVLADLHRPEHRRQLVAAAIDPFELVVVNLYPFAAAAARPDATLDELIEEIDIGGPTLVRAAAKNHGSVGVITDPAQYDAVVAELRDVRRLSTELRRELAAAAFRLTAEYDGLITAELSRRWWHTLAPTSSPAVAGSVAIDGPRDGDLPRAVSLALHRVEALRYGENPHQRAALYRADGIGLATGPFSDGAGLLQGKPLSYNNILDAAAAAGLARDLRGAGCAIIKHANPCGAAEADDALIAWQQALATDPVSAFGGVVALNKAIEPALAERLVEIFLEVVVAPACSPAALEVLASRPNLRVLVDPNLGAGPTAGWEMRSAGGALLLTDADVEPDDPRGWRPVTARQPSEEEWGALDFAWRVCRHVKSNAVVLADRGALVGVGAGQMSRVDSARLALAKAGDRARGAVCASDAFYPFPDALAVCAEAGVTAFVQPGGSQRDADVIATADAHGAAMLFTGRRHFRH